MVKVWYRYDILDQSMKYGYVLPPLAGKTRKTRNQHQHSLFLNVLIRLGEGLRLFSLNERSDLAVAFSAMAHNNNTYPML